eukprot:6204946-Pleurochrysis_carterae.AAC.1
MTGMIERACYSSALSWPGRVLPLCVPLVLGVIYTFWRACVRERALRDASRLQSFRRSLARLKMSSGRRSMQEATSMRGKFCIENWRFTITAD